VELLKSSYGRYHLQAPTYDQFRAGWMRFLKDVHFDEIEAFSCGKCGNQPEVVLFDGTFLSCRKDFLSLEREEEAPLPGPSVHHTDRIFLNGSDGSQLRKFALSTPESPVPKEEVQSLLDIRRLSALSSFLELVSLPSKEVC